MDNNRIGSACWYKNPGAFDQPATKWRAGRLRAWSVDYRVFDEGPGQFPAAVIEDDETQRCVIVYAANISFATVPPRQ